jgi:hypothetical protein
MAYRFFQVPIRDSGVAGEELNRFLRGHRVLSVDRRRGGPRDGVRRMISELATSGESLVR